jgi:hypothetical protein
MKSGGPYSSGAVDEQGPSLAEASLAEASLAEASLAEASLAEVCVSRLGGTLRHGVPGHPSSLSLV